MMKTRRHMHKKAQVNGALMALAMFVILLGITTVISTMGASMTNSIRDLSTFNDTGNENVIDGQNFTSGEFNTSDFVCCINSGLGNATMGGRAGLASLSSQYGLIGLIGAFGVVLIILGALFMRNLIGTVR